MQRSPRDARLFTSAHRAQTLRNSSRPPSQRGRWASTMASASGRAGSQQPGGDVARLVDDPLVGFQVGEAQHGLAGLARAEEFAGAADLQVAPRDLEAVGGLAHRHQALLGDLAERALIQQQADAGRRAAAHAPAQLVQLRQAEALGVLDHHQRGVRHVDADLDHGGGHQHVHLACREGVHDRPASPPASCGRAPGRRPGRAGLRPASRRCRWRSAAAALPILRSADRPSRPGGLPARPRARARSLRRAGSGRSRA